MARCVCALMIGREGSVGFPGKNLTTVLGRPLAEIGFMFQQTRHG
jgi:CMP-N-acetylneuraminic acid synthetase